MFTSMTAGVSTNTYCLARTRHFSRWSENFVGRVTHEREAPMDTVQLVYIYIYISVRLWQYNSRLISDYLPNYYDLDSLCFRP